MNQLNQEQARPLTICVLQFIRNAVVHGIENRKCACYSNKPEVGLDLSMIRLSDGGIELNVRDDGAVWITIKFTATRPFQWAWLKRMSCVVE